MTLRRAAHSSRVPRARRAFRPRRFLAASALLLAGALVASACDSSPFGVVVNGERIHQTAINEALRGFSSSPTFVKAYEKQAQEAAQQEGQTNAVTTVQGAVPGTYSTAFAAEVLDDLIQKTALRQYLAAHHRLPNQQLLTATRGWEAATQGQAWLEFSASFRDQQTEENAILSSFAQPPAGVAFGAAMREFAGYLFSRVCVRQVGFTVSGPGGQPDFAKSLTEAKAAASDGTLTGGVVTCYTLASLEREGNPLFHTVVTSDPGKPSAPQRTKFGYRVLEITQRQELPLNEAMKKVITALLQSQSATPLTPLQQQIVSSATVRLNPQYGTWDQRTASVVVNNASTA